MAQRWSKLKGRVPDAPVNDIASAADSKFRQLVDEAKLALRDLSVPELMALILNFNVEWDGIEARKKELNVQYEALGQLLKQYFESQNVTSMKNTDGQNFYLHVEPLVMVKNRDEAEKWVAADPALDYMWGIHPQTIGSYVKDLLDKLEDDRIKTEMPFLDVFLKTSVRVRKSE